MNLRRSFAAIVILLLVFNLPPVAASRASAQSACPLIGTFGKSVGRDFFVQIVGQLKDVPPGDFPVEALMAWEPWEGTEAFWNPLATTWVMGQACDFNPPYHVQNYPDQATGVRATANTLNLAYYDPIRRMLRLEAFDREAMRDLFGHVGNL